MEVATGHSITLSLGYRYCRELATLMEIAAGNSYGFALRLRLGV